MLQRTNNWAYEVTVVLTAFSGGAFIMSSRSAVEEASRSKNI
ncbi:hypothetical protein [Rhizobium sp.]